MRTLMRVFRAATRSFSANGNVDVRQLFTKSPGFGKFMTRSYYNNRNDRLSGGERRSLWSG